MAFTTQPRPAQYDRSLGGMSCPILHGEEKATQTYKKGAFLIDDDAGLITKSTTPIDASAVGKRTFGLALKDSTGVTSADVPFVWLTSLVILEITLSDNSAGVHTLAAADKWAVYAVAEGTTAWALDASGACDTGGIIVVGFKTGGVVGTTTDARVYGILTNTARGGADASSGTF